MKLKAVLVLGFLFPLFFFGFWQKDFNQKLISALFQKEVLLSPQGESVIGRPQILGEVLTLENNFNFGQVENGEEILAESAFVYDLTQNRIILEKDSTRKMGAASTIKLVTAAVALEKGKPEEEMTVNFFPTFVGESSQHLVFGEKFTLEELLYGLLLVSANDGAETIAQGLAGKREIFVSWMNDLAQKAGATQTHFINPSGLDEEGQYTTSYDLFLLGDYIFKRYPQILAISQTKEKYLPQNENHRSYLLRNKLLLLDDFPFVGGKAGSGEQGKLSLVALLEKDGRRVMISLVQTSSLRHDLTQILKKI